MKLGIIGTGNVGAAVAMAAVARGRVREIVLVNRNRARAKAVATDMHYGAALTPGLTVRDGDYADLADSGAVVITAGVNEKAGGATDRSDPAGRLRLVKPNVEVYREIVPRLVAAAAQAVIVVATDPPEPLVDVARTLAGPGFGDGRVLGTSTWLDSLRFRTHVAERLGVDPMSVEADVVGEHGTSSVFLWSAARIGGMLVADLLARRGMRFEDFRKAVEQDVRFANITIIEGIGASQYGIGLVSARIAEAILRDERLVIPVGSYIERYGTTVSLPSIVGRQGVVEVLEPAMSDDERQALEQSARRLKETVAPYL
jgi:L-lactate dehydrogenase